jgi:hypothetical protein
MAGVLQHLRSSTLNKRPNPASMVDGQLAINYASGSPGAFFKDSNGNLVKVGPVHVGATAPNVSPASGGTAGNSLGEQWLDTSGGTYVFKIWDGASWRSEAGEFVNVTGDTMTGALGVIAGSASTPGLFFSGDANSGLYSPGADQVAISTGGSGRLFVDASGRVGVGTSSPSVKLVVSDATSSNPEIRVVDGTVNTQWYASNNGECIFGTFSNHPQVFRTNGSERLRITSAGLVGIGTSTPDIFSRSHAQVLGVSSASGNCFVQANGATGSKGGLEMGAGAVRYGTLSAEAASVDLGTNAAIPLSFSTNNITRVTVDSSGRVGIGATTVNTTLEVLNSSTPIIRVGDGTRHVQLWGGSSTQNQAVGTATSAAFNININSSPVATFDTSGRLLVGTSSSSAEAKFIVQGGATAAGGAINIQRNATTASAGSTIGYISFANSANDAGAFISADGDGTWSAGTSHPTLLKFSTTADGASSPTERMKITRTGEIYVFCASGAWNHSANNGSGAGTESALYQGRYGATDNTGTTGTRSYVVWTNGNVQNTNNSYTAISDIKLKENVVDANSQWADIKSLQVRNYNLKEGQTHRQIGLIAQEVELISPGLVYESPDRDDDGNDLGTVTKSVNYSVLYMKAVKALQEAMERIETLEAKVAALESA